MRKRKGSGRNGYTLVELMVVIAIMAILATASAGVYTGYVERAREARLYETAGQIAQALMICETEHAASDGAVLQVFWSDAFLKPPNHPDSVLYPYVGDMTEDCTGYSLKVSREDDGGYHITGFTYLTEEYEVRWRKEYGITITKR